MNVLKQKLLVEQTDKKLVVFKSLDTLIIPENGWINTIRLALNMSLRQMGNRLKITSQSAKEIETREKTGAITLNSLREVGKALDLQFVYGFISKHDSLEAMIEKRAEEIAKEIVMRTSANMKLEDQENSQIRLNKAIQERTIEIKQKMPRFLWD